MVGVRSDNNDAVNTSDFRFHPLQIQSYCFKMLHQLQEIWEKLSYCKVKDAAHLSPGIK